LTNSELQLELKRAYADLDRARSQILEKDKCIASLTKRNQSLKDQVHSASDAVRTAKSLAKEAKAAALSTRKEAKESVNTMACALEQKEGELAGVKSNCSQQIRLKDVETRHKLFSMKEEMESTVIAKVNMAVGKSEVMWLRDEYVSPDR
jgi:glycine cleavage system pyridoxal-binding protein P